jgi:hypothetical protein
LKPGVTVSDVSRPIQDLIARELAGVEAFTQRLCRGEFAVC